MAFRVRNGKGDPVVLQRWQQFEWYQYRFYEESFQIERQHDRRNCRYNVVLELVETDLFLLLYTNREFVYIVDKRGMEKGDVSVLAEMVRAKSGCTYCRTA